MTTPAKIPSGWYPDPVHRHQYRFWSGSDWADLVSDNAVTTSDPLQSLPAQRVAETAPPADPPTDQATAVPPQTGVSPDQPAVAPGQAVIGPDARLSATIAEYQRRRYKIVGSAGGYVLMERPQTAFSWLAAVLLIILVGVGALLYVLGWAIWGVHRTYRVNLSIGPDGQVQETGDVLAIYDRDRLQAHRKRCIGFAVFFLLVAVAGLAGGIGSMASGSQSVAGGLVAVIVLGAVPAVVAFFLIRSAQTAAKKLGMSTKTWLPAG